MAESNIRVTDISHLPTQSFEDEQHGWFAYEVVGCTASNHAERGFEAGLRAAKECIETDPEVSIFPSCGCIPADGRADYERGFNAGFEFGRKVNVFFSVAKGQS